MAGALFKGGGVDMTDHEHDWWRTPAGTLECACGKSKIEPEEEKK
jgi:hypothetical protein